MKALLLLSILFLGRGFASEAQNAAVKLDQCLVKGVVDGKKKYDEVFKECYAEAQKKKGMEYIVKTRKSGEQQFIIQINVKDKKAGEIYELTSIAKVDTVTGGGSCCQQHTSAVDNLQEFKEKLNERMESGGQFTLFGPLHKDLKDVCAIGFHEEMVDGKRTCVRQCEAGSLPTPSNPQVCENCEDHFYRRHSALYKFNEQPYPNTENYHMNDDEAICRDEHDCMMGDEVWDEKLGNCRRFCGPGEEMVYEAEEPGCKARPDRCEKEHEFNLTAFDFTFPKWTADLSKHGCDPRPALTKIEEQAHQDIENVYQGCVKGKNPGRGYILVGHYLATYCSKKLGVQQEAFERTIGFAPEQLYYTYPHLKEED